MEYRAGTECWELRVVQLGNKTHSLTSTSMFQKILTKEAGYCKTKVHMFALTKDNKIALFHTGKQQMQFEN